MDQLEEWKQALRALQQIVNKLKKQFHKTRLTQEVYFVLTAEEASKLIKELEWLYD